LVVHRSGMNVFISYQRADAALAAHSLCVLQAETQT